MMTKQSTYECLECHRTKKEEAGQMVICQSCGQRMVEKTKGIITKCAKVHRCAYVR